MSNSRIFSSMPNIQHTHGRVTGILATDDASFMLGESFKLNGNCFLAFLFFASLALSDETGIVLQGKGHYDA